jgi:hypothetical protein
MPGELMDVHGDVNEWYRTQLAEQMRKNVLMLYEHFMSSDGKVCPCVCMG